MKEGLKIFVQEILPSFIAVYFVAATWAYIEHEVIRELVPGVRYTRLGRFLESFTQSIKYIMTRFFGWSTRRPILVEQWAGLYNPQTSQAPHGFGIIQQAIQEEADAVCDSFTSKRATYRHVYYYGEEGSGTRQIAQSVYQQLSREHECFYFDCSAVTRAEVHKRFLSNLAAWANAAEIVALPGSLAQTNWQIQDVINMRKVKSFLKNYSRRTKNRPIIIIVDIERLHERVEASPYLKAQDVLNQLIAYKHSTVLITSNHFINIEAGLEHRFESVRKLLRPVRKLIAPSRGLESSTTNYTGAKKSFLTTFIKNFYPELDDEGFITDLNPSLKLDEFEVLMLLLEKLPKIDQLELLRNFNAWKPEKVSEHLFTSAIEIIRHQEVSQTENRTSNAELETLDQNGNISRLIAVMALFDAPVPLTAIIRLWTECHLNFALTFSGPDALPTSHEPSILKKLVEVGLVQRLFRSGPLYQLPVYVVKATFGPIGIEHLKHLKIQPGDIRLFDFANERIKDILL